MVVVAILALLIIITITTLLTIWLLNRRHKSEREEDLTRQDNVAFQAANASEITNDKLDTIHILVNSNMTAAMQAELDATVRELAMMKEVIGLNREAGRIPSLEAEQAVEITENKINELQAQLKDRLRQTHIAELREESERYARDKEQEKEI